LTPSSTSPSDGNWKQKLIKKCKDLIHVKEARDKLITAISESLIFVSLLAGYLVYGFIPAMQHVSDYEKIKNFDSMLALLGIGGAVLPFVIILTFGSFYVGKYNAKMWGYLLR